jgi:hypothetical protein
MIVMAFASQASGLAVWDSFEHGANRQQAGFTSVQVLLQVFRLAKRFVDDASCQ